MYSKTYKLLSISAISSAALLASSTTLAHSEGDFFGRIGLGIVMPNESSNETNGGSVGELGLNNDTNLAGTLTYMLSDNMGVEALLGLPFTHSVSAANIPTGDIADVSHLPLSITAQYYFGEADSEIRPYVGGGFNYTTFLDETGKNALDGKTVDVENSFGWAIQAGVDYTINEQLFINLSAWYLDIETTVSSSGVPNDIDMVIDPLAVLMSVGYTF